MNPKNCFFSILFLLPLVPLGMSVMHQQDEVKRNLISVKGRIIGYSMLSQFRLVHGQTSSPPHDAFLFLVQQSNKGIETSKYIKIQYRATPKHQEELPPALFEESSPRLFVVQRDETCDESAASFVRGNKPVGKGWDIKGAKRFPNLVRLRGAENVRLPKEGMLRCYSFDWDGIEK
jgi:hypothetical protein